MKPVLNRSKNDQEAIKKGVALIPANVAPEYKVREDESHLYHVLETSKIHLQNEQKYEDVTRLVKINSNAWESALNTIKRKGGNARKLIHDPTLVGNEAPEAPESSEKDEEKGKDNEAPSSVVEIVAAIAVAESVDAVDELHSLNTESVKVSAAADARKEELED
jgi:hypothetical protein